MYAHHDDLEVEAAVAQVVELLAEFGAREVPWETPMAARDGNAVDARLQAWAQPVTPANSVLYWVGHGWSDGSQVTLAHCLSPPAVRVYGVPPDKLAEPVRSRQATADGRWVIVIIDACWSKDFVDRVSADLDVDGLLLIGAAGDGPVSLGRFPAVLQACLQENFRTDRTIELWRLVGELDRRLPWGRVTGRRLIYAALVRQILPVAGMITVPLDVLRELEECLGQLSEDERRHFLVKAQGAEEGEMSWFFEGRATERAQIVRWLRTSRSGLLIVTGRSGAGKSALLGHVLVHSLPDLRGALTSGGLVDRLADHELPPPSVFNEVIHLTGIMLDELLQRIARAAGLGEAPSRADAGTGFGTSAYLDWLVDGLQKRPDKFTLLVDALDEANDPLGVARSVLRRIASVPGVRVLVGTRASTQESPDHPAPEDQNILDALGASHDVDPADDAVQILWVTNDPEAVTRYVSRRLVVARDRGNLAINGTPVDDVAINMAAQAIGDDQRAFLFARLAVYEILADPTLLAPARSLTFARLLAAGHRDLFAAAVTRLTLRSDSFLPLLEALALARGRGVPIIDGIWARMATALVDGAAVSTAITDTDISALLAAAQPYIAIDADSGQTVYRLAHRTFVEHFLTKWEF
jgi:hypothetical protein